MRKKKKPAVDFKKAITMEFPTEYYVALIVGIIFLVASIQKLMHPSVFADAVFRLHMVPYALVNSTALLLMSLELVAALAVVFMREWRRAGLWILVALLLAYTGSAAVNLFRGLNTVCAVFNFDPRLAAISYWTIVRGLALTVAALFALK